MHSIPRRSFVFALIAASAGGCAYRTPTVHMPASIPAKLDVKEVTVVDGDRAAAPELVSEVRDKTVDILGGAVRARVTPGGPARVRVRVVLLDKRDIYDTMRIDGMAVIGLFFAPFGFVIGRQHLSVDVSVDAAGRTFAGHGEADKMGGLYASALRRALASAFDDALAHASL